MEKGHPGLVSHIVEEIRRSGPIPFARFMELVLYHPTFGYYMRSDERLPIGYAGDYYTSTDLHPLLAKALARQVRQIDDVLDHTDPLTVIEMGGGTGVLARDFLTECAGTPRFSERLRYVLIERSPAMRRLQEHHLAAWTGTNRVSWLGGIDELQTGSVQGVLFSNELVDAFPVHAIRMKHGEAQELYEELYVDWEEGTFQEHWGRLSTPELAAYLRDLASCGIVLADGYRTEINLEALRWMRSVARVLGRGVVITIDYGHTARDRYGPERRTGTLLCYHRHSVSDEPLARVGQQDMTAHVDFTSLATAGKEAGLEITGFTNQMSFLIGLGIEGMLQSLDPESAAYKSAAQLLRPAGMGGTFKVLIQHKGMETPALDGLRYRPFFGSALSLSESTVGK